jgi:hypothetical protein
MQISAEMSSKWDEEMQQRQRCGETNAIQGTTRNEGLLSATKKNKKETMLDVLYSTEA